MMPYKILTPERIGTLIAIGLLLSRTTAAPLYPNATTPNANSTTPNANTTTPSSCAAPSQPIIAAAPPPCQTMYPSSYRIMNSRYPTWDRAPLHSNQKDFFMLLRQRADTFQVATQVQFTDVAAPDGSTCRLQLQLPGKEMTTTWGVEPIFNAYQVEREAGSAATWDMYVAKDEGARVQAVFGQVNGTVEARARQWNETGGLVEVGETGCNGTLTWQMGMAFDGGAEVNYWEFVGVAPPLNPVQGFRVVTGC